MARGRRELEAFAARWLEEHPERGVNKSVEGGDNLARDLAALVGDAGVVVEAPAAPVVIVGEPETVATFEYDGDRPHAALCFATPCDERPACTGCPGYVAWRAKVRPPFEVLR